MNRFPILIRTFLTFFGGLLLVSVMISSASAQAADVAVWGWRTKPWQELLKKQWSVESEPLEAEGDRVPVERFDEYRLVIIGQGKPAVLTPEEHRQMHAYLEKGGGGAGQYHFHLGPGTTRGRRAVAQFPLRGTVDRRPDL